MNKVAVISKIALIFFLYLLTYYAFIGIKNPIPAAGDSFDYHIPISLAILNGDFLTLSANTEIFQHGAFIKAIHKLPQWFYPGSSEAINSAFILFGIPLTLSNILAAIVLSLTLFKLGRAFNLDKYYSLLFSLSFVTLTAIVRWLNAVSIDLWIVTWLAWGIILLENPKKTALYFARLGFALGMLIGSKLIALYLFTTLFILYFKKIINFLSPKRAIAFALTFSLGLFWYIRNFALTNNPFYPVALLGFKGPFYESQRIFDIVIKHPIDYFNAAYSEYHLWLFSVILVIFILLFKVYKREFRLDGQTKIALIGLINSISFLSFPSSSQTWIMVSSIRYSLPAFMCFMLVIFISFAEWKKEEILGYFAIANMISILSIIYLPKLIIIYLPITLIIFYLLDRSREENEGKKMLSG